jgi:hypothetical protein
MNLSGYWNCVAQRNKVMHETALFERLFGFRPSHVWEPVRELDQYTKVIIPPKHELRRMREADISRITEEINVALLKVRNTKLAHTAAPGQMREYYTKMHLRRREVFAQMIAEAERFFPELRHLSRDVLLPAENLSLDC